MHEDNSTIWLPKNSVVLKNLPSTYLYKLIKPSLHDAMEWCPSTINNDHAQCNGQKQLFWNINLLDRLPSCELDGATQLYIDPSSVDSDTFKVIATLPLQTNIFPYHLQNGAEGCYKWLVCFCCAWYNTQVNKLHKLQSIHDIHKLNEKQIIETFSDLTPSKLISRSVQDSRQIWDITNKVHISYGNQHSSQVEEFRNGVPPNIHANELERLLRVLMQNTTTSHICDILQIRTHYGYSYHIQFKVELDQPLLCRI